MWSQYSHDTPETKRKKQNEKKNKTDKKLIQAVDSSILFSTHHNYYLWI